MSERETKDAQGRPIVVVTGFGIISPLGQGREDNWAALSAGRSGIRSISRFDTGGLPTTIAGTVDFALEPPFSSPELTEHLAATAAEEAIARSGIGSSGNFPGPLVMAVPPVELEWPQRIQLAEESGRDPVDYNVMIETAATGRFRHWDNEFWFGTVADRIADRFGTRGAPISISTACSSGATAIQLATEAIRRGETKTALAIGADGSVQVEALVRFSLLSALSTRNDPPEAASRPFSKGRDGFVMGEGAGAFVLEEYNHARSRGAEILGVIAGCGEKGDGFHRTRSSPDGRPAILAMKSAIADAGLEPDDIDYINAHGTSTPENDKMECLSCTALFGDRMARLPISSNKSMVGHTLTAAGAVEAVFSLLTIAEQRIPPTINYEIPDPAIELDVVPNEARDAKVEYVLSNSFGFGGQNSCLVFAAEPV